MLIYKLVSNFVPFLFFGRKKFKATLQFLMFVCPKFYFSKNCTILYRYYKLKANFFNHYSYNQ